MMVLLVCLMYLYFWFVGIMKLIFLFCLDLSILMILLSIWNRFRKSFEEMSNVCLNGIRLYYYWDFVWFIFNSYIVYYESMLFVILNNIWFKGFDFIGIFCGVSEVNKFKIFYFYIINMKLVVYLSFVVLIFR